MTIPAQILPALDLADPSWRPILEQGLRAMAAANPGYLPALAGDAYLPTENRRFAAFAQPLDKVRYVLVGEGDVPVKTQVQVLAAGGYKGYYGFEWEKRWHPEIPDPEVAFPHYAKTIAGYLAAAGISPS